MEPKIALQGHFWGPQDFSSYNPHVAVHAIMETSWCALAYGLGASKKMYIYTPDGQDTIPVDTLMNDAIELSMGIFTINLKHDPCKRLICNCKIM